MKLTDIDRFATKEEKEFLKETFSPGYDNEGKPKHQLEQMSLSNIAYLIYDNWKPVNYAAKPYLEAMASLDSINDNYMQDSGRSIVAYFLSNASQWKGDIARIVKKELNRRLKTPKKKEFELKDLTKSRSAVIPLKTEDIDKYATEDEKEFLKEAKKINKGKDIFSYHQIKVAKKALKTTSVGNAILGGPNHEEATAILKKHGYSDKQIKKLANEDVEKFATEEEKKVLKENWTKKLKKVYDSFEEFQHYDEIYNLAERLGFDSAEDAWAANPVVSGGIDPKDFHNVDNNNYDDFGDEIKKHPDYEPDRDQSLKFEDVDNFLNEEDKEFLKESLQLNEKWTSRLSEVYSDFEEFQHYDEIYNLAERLGFDSAEDAWLSNPVISGGVDPKDYKVVNRGNSRGKKI